MASLEEAIEKGVDGIQLIWNSIEISIYYQRTEPKYHERAYQGLQRIEDSYAELPPTALYDIRRFHQRFRHLPKFEDALHMLRQALDTCFEERSREALKNVITKSIAILEYYSVLKNPIND